MHPHEPVAQHGQRDSRIADCGVTVPYGMGALADER
jgi:hypothetical protein